MRKNTLIILSILVLALAGCGGDKTSTGSESNGGGLLSNIGGSSFYADEDVENLEPCEILNQDMVMQYADGVSEADITSFEIFGCQYSWDKSNSEEIEERNTQIILDNGIQNIMSLNLESSENVIALSYNDYYLPQSEMEVDNTFRSLTNRLTQEENDANRQALDSAIESMGSGDETSKQISETGEELGVSDSVQETLDEGFTEQQEGLAGGLLDAIMTVNPDDIYVDVNGIGDKAAWSEYSKNLVVQHKNFIFELNVDLESDSQTAAEELAKEILEKVKKEL